MAGRNHRDRRRRRRRGRFGILYILLSLLLVLAALAVGCVAFFRVNHVVVTGNSRYSAQEIISASGVESGDNLFLINRSRTAWAVMRALPYVKKASVIPQLPDTVELRVTETAAVAAVEISGERWLIDDSGKLVEKGDASLRPELPQVLGLAHLTPTLGERLSADQTVPETELKLESLKSLLTALQKRGLTGEMSEFIDLRAANAIYFGYHGDLTVVAPMSGDFDRLALSLQATIETFRQRGEVVTGTLDLTYGDERARLLTERWTPEQYQEKGAVSDGTGDDPAAGDPAEPGTSGDPGGGDPGASPSPAAG